MNKGEPAPSGWCLTGHHRTCAEFFLVQDYSSGCICPCHTTKEEK